MAYREATQTDVPDIVTFLQAHAESAMFPISNLLNFGLNQDEPFSVQMWVNADGPLRDVLTVTKAGMVMPYLPSGEYEDAAKPLAGRQLIEIIGPLDAARGVQKAVGLGGAAMELDNDETHFKLSLAQLLVPAGSTRIVPATEDLRGILTQRLLDYHISILGMTAEAASKAVPDRITKDIEDGRRVVLMQDETPVATTAFNAALTDIVQIGGVYTPPALRGRGFARRAVALHLELARARGVSTATLFANDPSAIAAYEAVGFQRIGAWLLAIFETKHAAQGAIA